MNLNMCRLNKNKKEGERIFIIESTRKDCRFKEKEHYQQII